MNQNTSSYRSKLRINEYDYDLPDNRIARYPLDQRDNSRLLVYREGDISEKLFSGLPEQLSAGDLLVINNTKVIHSRLFFKKPTGATIEIFCLEPSDPSDYLFALQSVHRCSWKCFAGNLKKWKEGSLKKEIDTPSGRMILEAVKIEQKPDELVIEFRWDKNITFAHILELTGETPIPPYLNRDSEEIDKERYQTVYSLKDGSVAAPTAGLHFTESTFSRLTMKKIDTANVTLHVGAGTFKPVQSEYVSDHEMHSEFFTVSRSTLEMLKSGHRLVSVGTTSLRTLESLFWLAIRIINKNDISEVGQWDPYQEKSILGYTEAVNVILEYMDKNNLNNIQAKTKLMILPGYDFKSARALITNFHQPKSTLLLLVSAFIGEDWIKVYTYALENEFRFLSYGDSSLLFRSF